MKKFIISISLILLLFVAFFLMLILTKNPMNLSLIGSGVATLIAGSYLGSTKLTTSVSQRMRNEHFHTFSPCRNMDGSQN